MKPLFFALICVLATISVAAYSTAGDRVVTSASSSKPRAKKLNRFGSRRELRGFLMKLARTAPGRGIGNGSGLGNGSVVASMDDASAGVSPAANAVDVTGGGGGGGREDEVITNLQTAGVDEGSIVKLRGNYLVVLRRGRLFTIDTSNDDLKTVSMINAYGPDIDPDDSWYDEMLISDENIVVVGYSYERGGTEIGLFRIDPNGQLSYRATYHLRSNDYFSSRNYASRLIGNKLIFYSPLELDLDLRDPLESFPALRRWHKGAKESEFRSIAPATSVYLPSGYKPDVYDISLHTVTTCSLEDRMSCTSKSIVGPSGNVFYVSASNVYVWASTWYPDDTKVRNRSLLFKMPLVVGEPSAIRVSGSPVDQLSFHEDTEQELNVLVRSDSNGDGMWKAEVAEGEVALLRLNPDAFNNGSIAASRSNYRKLEEPTGYSFQNRFIGDYVLYGTAKFSGNSNLDAEARNLFVFDHKTGVPWKISLEHDVQRIDLLGKDAIVVGSKGDDMAFTSVKLNGPPATVDSYAVQNAAQGETRTQGYFYKPTDEMSGTLGLPLIRRPFTIRSSNRREIASVLFLKQSSLRFQEFGELASEAPASNDDGCKASCIDWYGDARPIFARGRIFALLGYELVEGVSLDGRMRELRRLNFFPKPN